MRLSDLKTGEQGIIVKVTGYGGFRKRIVEMGFIRGKKVEVLLNAPLKDPIKYKIMGYEVSLRRSEAEMIEVVSEAEAEAALMQENARGAKQGEALTLEVNETCDDEKLERIALKKHKVINIALVGNPNCGKTSLFNFVSGAHEHVGNYSGVTVDAKEGHATFEGYRLNLRPRNFMCANSSLRKIPMWSSMSLTAAIWSVIFTSRRSLSICTCPWSVL